MASPELPHWISRAIAVLLPHRTADAAVGDLTQEYGSRVARDGARRARVWALGAALELTLSYMAGRVWRWLSPPTLLREMAHPRGAWRDIVHATRGLRRSPGFALLVVLTLGAGLATLIVVVGFVDTLVFRPLSTVEPDRLRRIVIGDRDGRTALRVSNAERAPIADATRDVLLLGAASLQPALVRVNGGSFQGLVEVVSGNYFTVLGATAAHGRLVIEADDAPGAAPVVVISRGLWRRLGGSPDVLGHAIDLNGAPFTVVGVADVGGTSSFFGASVDAWIAIGAGNPLFNRDWRTRVDERWMVLLARLTRPDHGASADVALERATRELARRWPDPWRERTLRTAPPSVLVGSQRAMAIELAALLIGLALLAFAVVCANVAGLFYVRGATGRRAAAIRLSMGAARGAVLRQAVAESILLSVLACLLALGLYAVVRESLSTIIVLPTLSVVLALPFDRRLVLTAMALGLAAGAALGLPPAWWLARAKTASVLRDHSGALAGGRSLPVMRRTLVAAQIAVALALTVQSTLLARHLNALASADLGVDSDRLIALDFDVEPQSPRGGLLPTAPIAREALARVRALPGVAAAAMSNRAPIDASTPTVEVVQPGASTLRLRDVTVYLATPGYFDTVGVPLLHGRAFDERDVERDVVIVNLTLARRLWPGETGMDRTIRLEPEGRRLRVIGISADSRYRSLAEAPQPHLYRPTNPGFGLTLLVRSAGEPRALLAPVQQVLDEVGPGVQGFFPRTHRDHVSFDLLPTRAAAAAATSVGIVTVTLGAMGLMASSLGSRTCGGPTSVCASRSARVSATSSA